MSVKTKNASILPSFVSATRYLVLLCMFLLLTACASTNTQTSADPAGVGAELNQDHVTLASKYENMAAEMRTKAHEQREILENNSFPAQFGKNQRSAKSRIEFKLRQYELAAEEYEEKAAFHHAMANELTTGKSVAESKRAPENLQLEKASAISPSENTGKF
jgi:hypothetical protein